MLKSEALLPPTEAVEVRNHRIAMIQFSNRVRNVTERADDLAENLRGLIGLLKAAQSSDTQKGWFL